MLSPRTGLNGGERGQEQVREAKKQKEEIENPSQDQPNGGDLVRSFFFPALPDYCETWSVNNWNKHVIEIKFPQKKETNNKPTQKQQNKQHPHTSQGTGQANQSGKFAN